MTHSNLCITHWWHWLYMWASHAHWYIEGWLHLGCYQNKQGRSYEFLFYTLLGYNKKTFRSDCIYGCFCWFLLNNLCIIFFIHSKLNEPLSQSVHIQFWNPTTTQTVFILHLSSLKPTTSSSLVSKWKDHRHIMKNGLLTTL